MWCKVSCLRKQDEDQRPDQRPDQTRPDQTRAETRPRTFGAAPQHHCASTNQCAEEVHFIDLYSIKKVLSSYILVLQF